MNIIIDATWVGDMYGTKVMHGGFRVTNEFLKRLGNFPQHDFILTNTNYSPKHNRIIKRYITEEIKGSNVRFSAREFGFLENDFLKKTYTRISRFISIPTIFPFLDSSVINKAHIFHTPVDPIPGIIRRNNRIKKFFTALDLIPLVRPDLSTVFLDYTKQLYDSLTPDVNILAISECTKRDILKYRPDLHPDKIRVTYLAADKKVFYLKTDREAVKDANEKLGLKNKKYFLTVNSLARYKNVEFIIDHFMQYLHDNDVNDLYLVMIGQNREVNYREIIEKKYGSADRVLIFDYIDDEALVNLYNGALGFLYMSLYEGFGLPILEAMQCGIPVICSNAASIPEVVGKAAILVEPTDGKSFIDALYNVHTDQVLRNTLIESGLIQAEKFSWENYASEVVRAYEEMK